MSRVRAFTLVELLIVIVIIGILVGITVISWTAVAARGRDSTRKLDLARTKQVLQQYYADWRRYPAFEDNQAGDPIFAASWQLQDNNLLSGCPHLPTVNDRLTPKYLSIIASDPQDPTDYEIATCANLGQNQGNRHLYISGPSDQNSGPVASPDEFGLLATLERPGTEALADNLNPLKSVVPAFGSWYLQHNAYALLGVNANYMITSKLSALTGPPQPD